MLFVNLAIQDSGLTVSEVVRGLPHDTAAFVVYALVGVFLYLIWRGNRKRPGKQP